jgi:hypothetical protein
VSSQEVEEGGWPELLIAGEADASIWTYPRLVEGTMREVAVENLDLIERLIATLRASIEAKAGGDATVASIRGLGVAGLTIALTALCPPAGLALDVALSAADIVSAARDYDALSDDARCHLDPRECLQDTDPSVIPLVLAGAGAALVVF